MLLTKGKVTDKFWILFSGTTIRSILEQPVKSLEKLFDSRLRDSASILSLLKSLEGSSPRWTRWACPVDFCLGEERDTFLPPLLRKRFFRTSLQQLLRCPGWWRPHDQVNKAITHVLHPSILQTKSESRWPPTPARTENTSYNSKTKTDYKMKKVVKYQFRRVTLTCITLPSLWQRENWELPIASDSAAALLIWKDTL